MKRLFLLWFLICSSTAFAQQPVNNAQVGGTATDTNSGNKSAGTQRVVIATDQPQLTNKLLVTPDSVALPANQSVNVSQINGVTPLMGNGVTGTGSHRVTVASDNTPFAVKTDQTTHGTTDLVAADVTKIGGTAVVADPCEALAKTQVAISQTASTKVISAAASKKNYICSLVIVAGAAEIVNVVEGTGTTCGTGTAAIVGSTTAANGMSFAANGGLSAIGGNKTAIVGSGTNVDTCLSQSTTSRVAGWLTYVQQ